jgi:hypothetical protein
MEGRQDVSCGMAAGATLADLTTCLQSQIGQADYLRRQGNVQVEATEVLSVGVRWGPVRTAVNGTVVARPVSTTAIRPGGDGTILQP